MRNWTKFKRMQKNLEKSIINEVVTNLMCKHYNQLYEKLVTTDDDKDIFNDTYLKLTYKYNPDKDFQEQFKWLFQQLKGAYCRDAKAIIHYSLDSDSLCIPDDIKDEELVIDKNVDLMTKLKSICQL